MGFLFIATSINNSNKLLFQHSKIMIQNTEVKLDLLISVREVKPIKIGTDDTWEFSELETCIT